MSILGKSSILRDPTTASVLTFKDLEDTPESYEAQANKLLLVSPDETGIIFADYNISRNIDGGLSSSA